MRYQNVTEDNSEHLAKFLRLIADAVEKRGGRYSFSFSINTPYNEVPTLSLDVEVGANEELMERASDLMYNE